MLECSDLAGCAEAFVCVCVCVCGPAGKERGRRQSLRDIQGWLVQRTFGHCPPRTCPTTLPASSGKTGPSYLTLFDLP